MPPPESEEKDEDLAPAAPDDEKEIGDPRRLYREKLADLPVEEREKKAKEGDALTMRALAFDPLPRVVTALMENPAFSTAEARVIAREHPSGVGLQLLAANPRLLADPEVRRRLLRNGHVSTGVVALLLRTKPLTMIYQVGISHDVPENTKSFARAELRRAFNDRSPDEKVALIIKTEGRVLNLVVGIALDGRTISMLVGRSAMSPMLIRNLAQWPTTPPPILVHLLKLPQVQRDKALQQAVMRHPNLPSQHKRA